MSKMNREHLSVARLLRFLKAKHARIKKSGKPHTATTVSCLVGDIEDAMDEMGKEQEENELSETVVALDKLLFSGVTE